MGKATVTNDTENAVVFNAFFTSVFTNQDSLKQSLDTESLEQGKFPLDGKSISLESISKPDTHKFTGHVMALSTEGVN